MKEFFRQHGLRILAVAAAVAVALSLLTYFSSTSSVLENIAGVLTYPFRAAATATAGIAAAATAAHQGNCGKETDAEGENRKGLLFHGRVLLDL